MSDLVGSVTDMADYAGATPSAEAWFAGGERVGYDTKARAIVAAQSAALNILLRREGDLAHAVCFLPGLDLPVQSTTLVAFDFSSLVVLEHLRRRLERTQRGEPAGGPDIRGVFFFNGGPFTDRHSPPWFPTPRFRPSP